MFNEVLRKLKEQGIAIQKQDYTTLEIMLLADDWFTSLQRGVELVAPYVTPVLSDVVKRYAPNLHQAVNQFM